MVFTRFRKTVGDDVCNICPEFCDKFCQYSTQCAADCNWVKGGGCNVVTNICTNVIDFDVINTAADDDGVAYDLWGDGIFPSDTLWTLRAKIDLTSVTHNADSTSQTLMFGLSDSDASTFADGSQDAVGMRMSTVSTGEQIWLADSNGASWTAGQVENFTHKFIVETLFTEIRRTSGTTYTIGLFSDACYNDLIERQSHTSLSASTIDLRYIKAIAFSADCTPCGTFIGNIDCVQFWNCTEGLTDCIVVKGNTEQTRDFEDLDACISTAKTASPCLDMSSSACWTAQCTTNAEINTCRELLTFDSKRDNSNDGLTFDLGGNVCDERWVARWKQAFTDVSHVTTQLNSYWGMFSSDSTVGGCTNQDAIYMQGFTGASCTKIKLEAVNGAGLNQGGTGCLTDMIERTFYIELSRCSATKATINLYNDACYKDLFATETDCCISACTVDLRFFGFKNQHDSCATSGTTIGTIDCFKFYCGVSVANTPTEETKTLCETFCCDCWSDTGCVVSVNACTNVLDWDFLRNSANHATSFDLGCSAVSDTQWTLRFKHTTDAVTATSSGSNGGDIGMFSENHASGSCNAQDFISISPLRSTGCTNSFRLREGNGVSPASQGATATFCCVSHVVGADLWWELKRTSGTTYDARVYRCPDYVCLIEEKLDNAVSACVTNLRFIKVENFNLAPNGGTLDGTIDCLKFWNANNAVTHQNTWCSNNDCCYGVDTQTKFVNWSVNTDDQGTLHDLGACMVSDTQWIMRYKLKVDTTCNGAFNNQMFVGLDSVTSFVSCSGNRDFYGIRMVSTSTLNDFSAWEGNGVVLESGSGTCFTQDFTSGDTWYVEIQRVDATNAIVRLFADACYTDLTEQVTDTISACIVGLRYIKINGFVITAGGTLEGHIDCLKFWNDTQNADGIPDFDSAEGMFSVTDVGGTINPEARFNFADTTACYSTRYSSNGVADNLIARDDFCRFPITINTQAYPQVGTFNIENRQNEEKQVNGHAVTRCTAGECTIPNRFEYVTEWVNSIEKIRNMTITNVGGSGSYDIGSCITIFACTT